MLHLGDWVVGVCALSCCEIGTEHHFRHVYCDSYTLNSLPHGLLRTHCDVQPPGGSSLKETDILPHIYRDCYQTMRERERKNSPINCAMKAGFEYDHGVR